MAEHGIGASVPRTEDHRFLTGTGDYTDDTNLSRQTYAAFVRSAHPHATFTLDTSAAAAAPGVVAILTGADLAGDQVGSLICGWVVTGKDGEPHKAPPHPVLAADTVRHVGDAMAIVVAESAEAARDAAEQVEVTYSPLPAAVTMRDALAEGAPQIHPEAPGNLCYDWEIGDRAATDDAFARASHVARLDLVNNRLIPNAMEPRAAIGDYNPATGDYTLRLTSQNPHIHRLVLAAFIQIAPSTSCTSSLPTWAEGSGPRSSSTRRRRRCCGRRARSAGRSSGPPIARSPSSPTHTDATTRPAWSSRSTPTAGSSACGSRRGRTWGRISPRSRAAYRPTSTAPCSRASTRPRPSTARSRRCSPTPPRWMRYAARAARRRHTWWNASSTRRRTKWGSIPRNCGAATSFRRMPSPIPPGSPWSTTPGTTGSRSTGRWRSRATTASPRAARRRRRRGKLRGIGLSAYIEACGIAPSQVVGSLGAGVGLWESGGIRFNPTGNVLVYTGSHSHGQGHETTFAQVVSDYLGVPFENIEVVHGDTEKTPFGMGTYGSRSLAVGGSALVKAMDKIIAKGRKIAAFTLEASEEDIEFGGGNFTVAGTDRSMNIAEVAFSAYVPHNYPLDELEPGLEETGFYDPANFTFPAGTHVCEVEVDPDTGATEVVSWVAVDDFGNVVNPMIVEGQVHGGVAQGVGQALLEGCAYDADGQLVTGSYMDYTMPRADDLPDMTVETTCTPCPHNPLGVKGCGEAGAIAAPAAVMNAITHAIGTSAIDMPATSQAVWRALNA